MKKVLATFFTFLAAFCITNAQDPQLQWAKSFGGVGTTSSNSIAVDASGNTFLAGTFGGITDFDPGADTLFLSPKGFFDIFIMKLNASGKLLWVKQIGGNSECKAYAIATDQTGNVYATGSYKGTVDFNPNAGEFVLSAANNGFVSGSDIFVLKLDGSGEFLWAGSMGGSSDDYASAITIDKLGNVLTTGRFQETADFDPGSQNFTIKAGTNDFIDGGDVFVLKLTSAGKFVWAKHFSGSSDEAGTSVATDNDGNVYTTGYFSDTTDFDPSKSVVEMIPTGNNDAFVAKLDGTGKLLWVKQIGNTSFDEGLSIAVDGTTGNIYTTGVFTGTVYFKIGTELIKIPDTKGNVYILQLNPQGEFVWVKSMKGVETNTSAFITVDKLGSAYCINQLGVVKFNSNGVEQWSKNSIGSAIIVDAPGNIYTTGLFKGVIDADPNDGVTTLNANGLADAFVIKLSQGSSDVVELNKLTVLSAYPNPTRHILTILFGEYLHDATVSLRSLLGQSIETRVHISNAEQSFDISALAEGMYSYEVVSNVKKMHQWFVKE